MEALSGQSFIPTDLGRVDEEQMIPPARGRGGGVSHKKNGKISNVIEEVVDIARQINLDVDSKEFKVLRNSHNQDLTMDELIEMQEQAQHIEELKSLDPIQSEDRLARNRLVIGRLWRARKNRDKLDLTRFSDYKFRSTRAKGARRYSAPRARNELKAALGVRGFDITVDEVIKETSYTKRIHETSSHLYGDKSYNEEHTRSHTKAPSEMIESSSKNTSPIPLESYEEETIPTYAPLGSISISERTNCGVMKHSQLIITPPHGLHINITHPKQKTSRGI
ncbi:hypothetical protein TNCV_766461 [Trichonephila clavipes]|nr:hypothetical protein TNCV_766461 [Trichonephila clavipes]